MAYGRGDEEYTLRYAIVATANPDVFALPNNEGLRARLFPLEIKRVFRDVNGLELHEHLNPYRDHYWALAARELDSNFTAQTPSDLQRVETFDTYTDEDELHIEAIEAIYEAQARMAVRKGVSLDEVGSWVKWQTMNDWAKNGGRAHTA